MRACRAAAHRDIETFVTAGGSGGGPHALACAALLAPRCRAAATIAGVGPYGIADDVIAAFGGLVSDVDRAAPGARLAYAPDEGHISLLTNHRDVMLRDLAAAAERRDGEA